MTTPTKIKIKTSDKSALISACWTRMVAVEFIEEKDNLCYALIHCDQSQCLYLMIEFGERLEQERQFNERCDRVGGSLDNAFKMLSDFNRPNC